MSRTVWGCTVKPCSKKLKRKQRGKLCELHKVCHIYEANVETLYFHHVLEKLISQVKLLLKIGFKGILKFSYYE